MSVYIDRKYLGTVSHKLELFKQKNNDLYNFRCPFCNDSRKNKIKARGYIYRKANDYFYRCHNCGKSTTFSKFLQEIDVTLHKAYTLERYSNGETTNHNYKKPDFSDLKGNAFAQFEDKVEVQHDKTWKELSLTSVDKLPEGHYAKDYIINRKIPEKYWCELYFTSNFKEFLDTEFPEHGKENVPEDDRIVLCYTNERGEITNVAGRALSNTKIRYMTVKIKDEKKIFGLHRIKKDKRIYVFEGQFDSLFVENSVASGDSNLSGVAQNLVDCDVVLVYDNEPRNKDIVKQINKSIENGYSVCLFPDTIPYKDVNDMVQSGDINRTVIEEIIDGNTFKGLAAKLQFAKWRKC